MDTGEVQGGDRGVNAFTQGFLFSNQYWETVVSMTSEWTLWRGSGLGGQSFDIDFLFSRGPGLSVSCLEGCHTVGVPGGEGGGSR